MHSLFEYRCARCKPLEGTSCITPEVSDDLCAGSVECFDPGGGWCLLNFGAHVCEEADDLVYLQ